MPNFNATKIQSKKWTIVETASSGAREFVKLYFIQRYLGPAAYGDYISYLALFVLLAPFANLGLGQNLGAAMGKNSIITRDVFASLFWTRITVGSIVASIGCGAAMLIPELQLNTSPLLLLLFALAQIFQVGPLLHAAIRQDHLFKLSAFISSFLTVAVFFVALVIIFLGGDINWIASLLIFESVLAVILFVVIIKPRSLWPNPQIIGLLFVGVIPITLVGATVVGCRQIDLLILRSMSGSFGITSFEIGQYGAAVKYIAMAIMPGATIAAAMRTNINTPHKNDMDLAISNTSALVGKVSIFCTITLFIFGPTLVVFVSGQEYASCGSLVRILSPTVILVNAILVFTMGNVAYNTRGVVLMGSVCALLSNVALNFLLIPKFGIVGAAVATVVSYPIALAPGILKICPKKVRRGVISSFSGIHLS